MVTRAVIFGVTGQDGSYLAEFLLEKGYEVVGVARSHSQGFTGANLDRPTLVDHLALVNGDMTDEESIRRVLGEVMPDEVYNLAAISFVGQSWQTMDAVMDTNASGAVRIFRAAADIVSYARIYQASSSEMFGNVAPPQDEATPMRPVSPYGVSKLAAHLMAHIFRESHGSFISCGICFNHESERRGPMFVSRKIANGVAAIVRGEADTITLGDLTPMRDWGYAPDYVRAMWMMLQQDAPGDFVIASGRSRSVGDFAREAFRHVGITEWEPYIRQDKKLLRPTDVRRLVGAAKKARQVLGWMPTVGFDEMVAKMVDAEIEAMG